jgi:hypothetical protein
MARSLQITQLVSDEARAEFLNFDNSTFIHAKFKNLATFQKCTCH